MLSIYFLITSEKPVIEIDDDIRQYTVLSGEELAVGVTVTGHPPPDVRWTLDGRNVNKDKAVLLETDRDRHKMVITSTEVKHEGRYKIIASNDGGVATKEVTVTVEGKLRKKY